MKTKLIAATLLGLLGMFNSPVTAHATIPRDQIGGKELSARLEAPSPRRLAVVLDDAGGEYLELWFCCDLVFVIVVAAAAFTPINFAPFKAQRRLPPSPQKGQQLDEIGQELPVLVFTLPIAGRQRLIADGFDLLPSQSRGPMADAIAGRSLGNAFVQSAHPEGEYIRRCDKWRN